MFACYARAEPPHYTLTLTKRVSRRPQLHTFLHLLLDRSARRNHADRKMEEICGVLGNVSEREGDRRDQELIAFTQALKNLLLELPAVGETAGEGGVLAKVLVMAAGHSGQHYWTKPLNRQLANG